MIRNSASELIQSFNFFFANILCSHFLCFAPKTTSINFLKPTVHNWELKLGDGPTLQTVSVLSAVLLAIRKKKHTKKNIGKPI